MPHHQLMLVFPQNKIKLIKQQQSRDSNPLNISNLGISKSKMTKAFKQTCKRPHKTNIITNVWNKDK